MIVDLIAVTAVFYGGVWVGAKYGNGRDVTVKAWAWIKSKLASDKA